MKLTQKYGQPDIPVAYMSGPITGATQLNTVGPQNLPPTSYKTGIDTYLTEWVPTEANLRPPAWQSADQLMEELLLDAAANDEKIHILALGTWTTMAGAIHRGSSNRSLNTVLKGLGKVFVSGFEFNPRSPTKTMNDVNTTAYVPYLNYTGIDKPDSTSWNIFLDPISASQVLSAIKAYNMNNGDGDGNDDDDDPTVIVMGDTAETMMFLNPDDDKYIPPSCSKEQTEYLTKFYKGFAPQTGQEDSDVKYWDPSAVVLLLEHFGIMYDDGKPYEATFCTKYQTFPMQVVVIAGPQFSLTVQDDQHGTLSKICMAANIEVFKKVFFHRDVLLLLRN